MALMISEILEQASQQKTKKEKIDFLRKHDNPSLRIILKNALDPQVKWLLPEGAPPYKKSELHEAHGMLYSNIRKMYLFIDGQSPPGLTTIRREALFIDLLESVDPKDAELLLSVKDKKIPYKGITENLVKEAFEGLLP